MSEITASRDCFERAITLAQGGNIELARKMCAEYVAQHPSDINIQALLGSFLIALQKPYEALEPLQRAVKIAPGYGKAQADLGHALIQLDEAEQAVQHLEKAIQLEPELEQAWFDLGKAYARLNRHSESDEAYNKSFELSPERGELARAVKLYLEGEIREAEEICRGILRKSPDNINAMRQLARISTDYSQFEDAEVLLRKVVQLAPDFVDAWIELSGACKEQEKFDDAIECAETALKLEPENPQCRYVRAGMLALAGYTYEAIDAYQQALAIRPKHAPTLLGLGHVLKTVGRQGEGVRAYREAIGIMPEFGEVYWSLANLKTFTFSGSEIMDMEKILARESLSDEHRVHFNLTLAKAYEDRDEYDTAFSYYQRGNDLQRLRVTYDPVSTEVMNDRIIDTFDAEIFTRHAGGGCQKPDPVFIVGLPRSGSTLIEQILASHSQVDGTSELHDLGRLTKQLNRRKPGGKTYPEATAELDTADFLALGEEYLQTTRRHRGDAPFFTDKMPNNFPTIGFLHLILPNARVIDARRHPLDSCLGCYKQLFAKGQTFTYDLVEIGEFYLEYLRLMDHWDRVLPGRVLRVQYEELILDFDNQVRRLLDYCGLDWEQACLRYYETERAIKTASSEQVRLPVYKTALNRWKNYEKQLQPLVEVLQPVLPDYDKYT